MTMSSAITFDNFCKIYEMGGHSRIRDPKTGEVVGHAEKIDLNTFDRDKLRFNFLELFRVLNEQFAEKYKRKLWPDFSVIENGEAFSGSTKFLFDPDIDKEEFTKHKAIVGDIDVMVPSDNYDDLASFMPSLQDKVMTKSIKYLGQDRDNFGTTFLAVFEYVEGENTTNVQVDFENGQFEKRKPTEWAKFSHSADWDDIKGGIKGVHHKFLVINLARVKSKRDDIVIATPASTPEKLTISKGKKASETPRLLAFSVDRGLRLKYEQMKDREGNPLVEDGKPVFKEISVAKSNYVKNLTDIFTWIFGEEISEDELKKTKSFLGLAEVIRKRLTEEEITDLLDYIVDVNLFGDHAQVIEKGDATGDYQVKQAMVEKMIELFPHLKGRRNGIEKKAKEYYIKKFKD